MKRILAFITTALLASPAFAVDKIYAPYVEAGEWEMEYFGHRSVDRDGSKNNAQVHEFSLEHGVNDWWQTEFYAILQKEPGDNVDFDAVEWENIFEFTRPGEYWVDTGASLAYEWTPDGDQADALEARLLFAKNIGMTTNIFNISLEKEVGGGTQDDLEAALLWSSRYNYSPYFQPGFEIQSEMGEVNDSGSFESHEHYVGPFAYGVIPFEMEDDGKEEGLQYRLGYLFGISDAASNGQLVMQLEYEIDF